MIVTIHQPHFLPWTGYFNKALSSDAFVWLHTVDYRKNYFQNRTKIRSVKGQSLWLTVPVHAKLGMAIDEVKLADQRWPKKIRKTIEQCYQKTPYFDQCAPVLWNVLDEPGDSIDSVNYKLFLALLELLGCESVRVVRAGDLDADSADPTTRLVQICQALNAKYYLSGRSGSDYLRTAEFNDAGIKVIFQDFDPGKVVYHQVGEGFVPGLSIIDCLFNIGPDQTRQLVKDAWTPTR